MLLKQVTKFFDIGGLHCRYVGVQNKRKFVHIVCIKMAVKSQRRISYCPCTENNIHLMNGPEGNS